MAKRKAAASPTLTVEQAGQELGISRNSAYEAAKRGDIPAVASWCRARRSSACWPALASR